MIVLLVRDERARRLFRVLQLLELDKHNVFKLSEVLAQVFDSRLSIHVKFDALKAVHDCATQLLDLIINFAHDAFRIINRELVLHFTRFVDDFELIEFFVTL